MFDSERKNSRENLKFLWASGNLYAEKNPKLSKYLISKFHRLSSSKITVDGQTLNSLYCPHCFSILRPDNHAVRLTPKLRISRQIMKIKCKAAKDGIASLTKEKARRLKRWEDSQTKLSVQCKACRGTTKIPGSKRCISQANLKQEGRGKVMAKRRVQDQKKEGKQSKGNKPSTPVTPVTPRWNVSLKQGQFNSKFPSPLLTPTLHGFGASPSTTPSGPLTASARKVRNLNKQKRQQLQRMLDGARREKANAQSPLKDFLVSL